MRRSPTMHIGSNCKGRDLVRGNYLHFVDYTLCWNPSKQQMQWGRTLESQSQLNYVLKNSPTPYNRSLLMISGDIRLQKKVREVFSIFRCDFFLSYAMKYLCAEDSSLAGSTVAILPSSFTS